MLSSHKPTTQTAIHKHPMGREGGVMSCLDTPCNQTLSGLAKCVYVHDCMDSMKSVYMCHCAVWLSTSTIMSA